MKLVGVHSGLKVRYFARCVSLVAKELPSVSVGFNTRYVFRNSTIIPIFIHTDSYFDWVVFRPSLPDGLYYDKETRRISGIFPDKLITYTITVYAWYKSAVTSSIFTLGSKGILFEIGIMVL